MIVLEVIRLRSTQYPIDDLHRMIVDSIPTDSEFAEGVSVLRSTGLNSDIAVHLCRKVMEEPAAKSILGNRLASALRTYGIVEHSLWEEMK